MDGVEVPVACDNRVLGSKEHQISRTRINLQKSKTGKWTQKDKKVLFSVLRQYGHENIQKFLEALPGKTVFQVGYFLKKFRNRAAEKLKRKRDYNVLERLEVIHPWLPFLNLCCNVDPEIDNYLVAYILPLIEQCSSHPEPKNVGNVDFKLAYRALFYSLTERKFPENMNIETFSMLYASIKQLLIDLRIENNEDFPALSKCIQRCLASSETKENDDMKNSVLQLPEVNAFSFNDDDIQLLCKNKRSLLTDPEIIQKEFDDSASFAGSTDVY